MGKLGWLYCFLIGSTSPAFVCAVKNTSVANVVFIFAAMPIFAALFSYFLLGEPIATRVKKNNCHRFFRPGFNCLWLHWKWNIKLEGWLISAICLHCLCSGINVNKKTPEYFYLTSLTSRLLKLSINFILFHRPIYRIWGKCQFLSSTWDLNSRWNVLFGHRTKIHKFTRSIVTHTLGNYTGTLISLGGTLRVPG